MTYYRETRVYLPDSLSDEQITAELEKFAEATQANACYRDPANPSMLVFVRRIDLGEEEAA